MTTLVCAVIPKFLFLTGSRLPDPARRDACCLRRASSPTLLNAPLAPHAPHRALARVSAASAQDGPLLVFAAGSLARPLRAALDSFAARQQDHGPAGELRQPRSGPQAHRSPAHPRCHRPRRPGGVHAAAHAALRRGLHAVRAQPHGPRVHGEVEVRRRDRRRRTGTRCSSAPASRRGARIRASIRTATARSSSRSSPSAGTSSPVSRTACSTRARSATCARTRRTCSRCLQAGEFDYAWSYESMAEAAGLRYLRLPPQIDLSDPNEAARYAEVSVKVAGATRRDSVIFRGEPIVYGIAVPVGAPHRALGERFVAWLTSPEGIRVLRAAKLDALEQPRYVAGRRRERAARPPTARRASSPRCWDRSSCSSSSRRSVQLVAAGGASGAVKLFGDGELRASLALTALTATAATLLGIARRHAARVPARAPALPRPHGARGAARPPAARAASRRRHRAAARARAPERRRRHAARARTAHRERAGGDHRRDALRLGAAVHERGARGLRARGPALRRRWRAPSAMRPGAPSAG